MANALKTLTLHESITHGSSSERDYQELLHTIPRVTSIVVASVSSGAKIHYPSKHNVLKDKEELYNGAIVGYKEANGIRTWASIATNGDTTEKEPQGVFVCPEDTFNQDDKTKFTHPSDVGTWTILTGGVTVNLSALKHSGEPLVTMSMLPKKPSTAESDGESLLFD